MTEHDPTNRSAGETPGLCQVCGQALEGSVVYCMLCATPHHEECFTWVGQCSTYSCGCLRFSRVGGGGRDVVEMLLPDTPPSRIAGRADLVARRKSTGPSERLALDPLPPASVIPYVAVLLAVCVGLAVRAAWHDAELAVGAGFLAFFFPFLFRSYRPDGIYIVDGGRKAILYHKASGSTAGVVPVASFEGVRCVRVFSRVHVLEYLRETHTRSVEQAYRSSLDRSSTFELLHLLFGLPHLWWIGGSDHKETPGRHWYVSVVLTDGREITITEADPGSTGSRPPKDLERRASRIARLIGVPRILGSRPLPRLLTDGKETPADDPGPHGGGGRGRLGKKKKKRR